ncbi:hypothetical protein BP00DRAFT_25895 [Aspergillus indologenus CBS 114.80]|uniref:Uncharacterized protein n=1 Tax=Aspergillus indologenus CBS 114.80 TaxID=1450541 RepID=A0A2V5J049_9EURO|nr:hypothetical protein BP00DRAFT_25895 [Aspergillus indologenus CBS 114.80]
MKTETERSHSVSASTDPGAENHLVHTVAQANAIHNAKSRSERYHLYRPHLSVLPVNHHSQICNNRGTSARGRKNEEQASERKLWLKSMAQDQLRNPGQTIPD